MTIIESNSMLHLSEPISVTDLHVENNHTSQPALDWLAKKPRGPDTLD